jgi:hypothetical protein
VCFYFGEGSIFRLFMLGEFACVLNILVMGQSKWLHLNEGKKKKKLTMGAPPH